MHTPSSLVRKSASLVTAILAAGAFTGCVSSKYRMAPKDMAPPVALNLVGTAAADATVAPPAVGSTLRSVIVYRGPGSWKRDAYWDEYGVTLTNRSEMPVTLESATLKDRAQAALEPGTEPWSLEKSSRTAAQNNFGLAKDVVIQVGTGAVTAYGGMLAAFAATGFSIAGSAAPIIASGVAAPVLIVGGSIYRNATNRRAIEDEFRRRRLVLPLIIPPGQTVDGSLFFRVTPSPQHLALKYRSPESASTLSIDLTPLASLHLKPASGTGGPAAALWQIP